jgi:hypothetical protein
MADKYNMSFTTGGLFRQEAEILAGLYMESNNWDESKKKVLDDNLFQVTTQNALKRIVHEISHRLKLLREKQLEILVDGTPHEKQHILWLAACKRFDFIREFAVEVLRERYLQQVKELCANDFDQFFRNKAEWHEELSSLTDATKDRLRHVVFKMMREAELISKKNEILPAILSYRTVQVINSVNDEDVLVFPISETELREWAV